MARHGISKEFPRIGIVGGGQLGKMLCISAKRMGLHVSVLDPTPECPAASVSDEQIVADFKDEKAIRELASKSDFLTFEIELADSKVLKELEEKGCVVNPKPETLFIIQSKLRQKKFLQEHKLPVPKFCETKNAAELKKALEEFNGHAMLKASSDSYDGRGNLEITRETDLENAMKLFEGRELLAEEWIDFEKEISAIVARNPSGQVAVYPISENIHRESILDMTIVPARISEKAAENAMEIAKETMQCLKGAGVFCIEMFLEKNGNILINEIAPRVHNSGHYTIEACKTSQFEQHLRAIMDWHLGSTKLLHNAVMVNILGKGKSGKAQLNGVKELMEIEGASLHLYGKHESKHKRKMGHVTILEDNAEKALEKAKRIKEILSMEGI